MNYIGSKYKLTSFIKDTIQSLVGNLHDKIFCEIFAGTGVIARSLKNKVQKIIVNDFEDYSYVLNRNYIGNHIAFPFEELINQLNNLKGFEGIIYNNYCLGSGSNRQYFSDDNGKKIDAIRQKIKEWKENTQINLNQYYFLLASLVESADKIANTASVYGAFLKILKKSAQKQFVLQPAIYEINKNEHETYQEDANELIKKIKGDVLYLDPPYNNRQYGSNYHLLNTIVKYDYFIPQWKTGLREYKRSKYCQKDKVTKVFEDLIKNAKFKYILLSYNNEGLMTLSEIKILERYGEYKCYFQEYQRFKADKDENRFHKADKTIEYLHCCIKNNLH